MKRFELELEDWHMTLEVTPCPNYRPDSKFTHVSPREKEEWIKGSLSFYSLVIVSRPLSDDAVDPLIHYTSGILLPESEEEMLEDLEIVLDEEGLLDHVLMHWQLIENTEGPDWKVPV